MHHAELHHRTHIERGQEPFKCDFKVFWGMAAKFDAAIHISRGFAISVSLLLLLRCRRRRRHCFLRYWRGFDGAGSTCSRGQGRFFCLGVSPYVALAGKQTAVGYGKSFLFFLSHICLRSICSLRKEFVEGEIDGRSLETPTIQRFV